MIRRCLSTQAELKKYRNYICYLIEFIIIAALILILVNNFKVIKVSGDSMNPTLSDGQIVILKKHCDSYKMNDIVVFSCRDELCVKRIIGLPSENVYLTNGEVYVNDVLIKPYYYGGESTLYELDQDDYFVVGDNFNNSVDSRDYGPINSSDIIGKVILIL